MTRSSLTTALLIAALGVPALGQSSTPASPGSEAEVRETTRAILAEIDRNSRLMDNLEFLCDRIGPRLTGSPQLDLACRWLAGKFRDYGLSRTRLEGFKIARAWTRRAASGRVVAPTKQRLMLESAGWSPSTPGKVRGPIVYPIGDDPSDIEQYRGKLAGAWVITEPVSIHLAPNRMAHAPAHDADDDPLDTPGELAFRKAFDELMVAEGAAGFLRDSDKEHGLFRMASASDDFTPSRFPEALLTTESYGLIWRLRQHGPVEVEVELRNEFSPGEVEVFNTVAELPGVEKPGEVVILGAHLDSWDLGTGATDNGTGCMAVLEAARALKAVGARPRRTIRFVLFAGEEEGRQGSRAYVQAHAAEMDRVSAVLIQDMGTGRVRTLALQGRYDLREVMDRVVAPFQEELGLEELSMRKTGGTDHLSFQPMGVPAFAVRQELAEYFKTHHTESDTFDKVYPDAINQAAKVLAAWAYNVAMLPECLPRAPGYGNSPHLAGTPTPTPSSATSPAPANAPGPAATGMP